MTCGEEQPVQEKSPCGGYYCSEEVGHVDCTVHEHSCGCGYVTPHNVGEGGCLREFAIAPVELNNDWWQVEGKGAITGFSLRDQRGYHQHSCGCWSRSKGGSTNSIDA